MITSYEARERAEEACKGTKGYAAMVEKIELDIMSEADSGNCGTVFTRDEFESVVGIEFVIADLIHNGFKVDATYSSHGFRVDATHSSPHNKFESMYVSW